MAQFNYVTLWQVEAPIESVWDAIHTVQDYPSWWSFVANVVEINAGEDNGLGAVHRFDWKTRLPYTLSFESKVVRIEKPNLIEASVDGELVGRGIWRLSETSGISEVHHHWEASTRKAWMNLLAPLMLPAFKWNHAAVMRAGGEGLARYIGVKLLGMQF